MTSLTFQDVYNTVVHTDNLYQHRLRVTKSSNNRHYIAFSRFYADPARNIFLPTKTHYLFPLELWPQLKPALNNLNAFLKTYSDGAASTSGGSGGAGSSREHPKLPQPASSSLQHTSLLPSGAGVGASGASSSISGVVLPPISLCNGPIPLVVPSIAAVGSSRPPPDPPFSAWLKAGGASVSTVSKARISDTKRGRPRKVDTAAAASTTSCSSSLCIAGKGACDSALQSNSEPKPKQVRFGEKKYGDKDDGYFALVSVSSDED